MRWLSTVAVLFTAIAAYAADEKAYLRLLPPDDPQERVIEVAAAQPSDLSRIRATLLAKGNPAHKITAEPSSVGAFRLRVPKEVAISAADMATLLVEDETAGSFFLVPVESEIRVSLGEPRCTELPEAHAAILAMVTGVLSDSRNYGAKRAETIMENLQSLTAIAGGSIEISPEGDPEKVTRKVERSRFQSSIGGFNWCLQTAPWEKNAKSYKLVFTPPQNAPFELSKKLETTLSISQIKPEKATAGGAGPGTRAFERNLDLATLMSSSVKDGARTTQGSLDIRLAPVLNWQATPVKRVRKPIWWWTPVFFDAKVATGKLTKETLSTNTIVFGSEAEIRYYFNTKPSPDMLRGIIRLAHASDRDFKQAEIKGVFELQPLPGGFWRPMRTWVDTTGRTPVDRVVPTSFGYEFKPAIGMELGRRYTETPAAAPFPGSPAVRRVYVSGELILDLTMWLKVTLKDKLYFRGEAWQSDRYHNWFNGEAAVPVGGSSAHHFFVSFERGGQPPFSTPDANAVKAGYRVLMDGWLGRTR